MEKIIALLGNIQNIKVISKQI